MEKYDYNLLIVEDSKMINKTLCESLSKSSTPRFNIHSAMTLKDAKEILDKEKIHFVVLDLELPDGSGEELVTYIKDDTTQTDAKVVVLTSSAEKMRRDKLFEMGIIDYLSKDNPMNFLSSEIVKNITQFVEHKKYKILVVDDSKFFANFVASILTNQNYTVTTCLHSTEVLQALKDNPVQLLLTDLEMPEMSGFDLLRKIREDNKLLELPIIGLSGTSNQDLISKVLKSGANDFLAKPFSIETLLLKVDVVLTLYKKKQTLMELNQYLEDEVRRNVEEIRSKDQLLELDNRHAQMGQMIGALTHQWKQPLSGINFAASYMEMLSKQDSEMIESVKTIQEQVAFLAETMDYFRDFFKPGKTQEPFSIVDAFNDVLKLLGETYGDIEFHINGDEKLLILGYPNEFYQIIINLFNNAQDAFLESKINKPTIEVDVVKDGTTVLTTVCDNAGGIDEEIISSVFEQFTSTKDKYGTGIGLHMSRSVIEKMGGVIDVRNTKKGACFSIILSLKKSQ